MAKSKSEAAYNDATRRQEQANAPLPETPRDPDDTRPPLSASAQARLDDEMRAGREALAAAETEQARARAAAALHRADALAEGKSSPDDLA
jgi:hypothetical protein